MAMREDQELFQAFNIQEVVVEDVDTLRPSSGLLDRAVMRLIVVGYQSFDAIRIHYPLLDISDLLHEVEVLEELLALHRFISLGSVGFFKVCFVLFLHLFDFSPFLRETTQINFLFSFNILVV
jgi:hypothetical protein